MSSSYSFSIQIIDEQDIGEQKHKSRQSTIYLAIEQVEDSNFIRVIELQQLIKSQNLLFQYQQKRKNERIKEIQYNYTNSFSNYLWTTHIDKKQSFMMLNHKDLISIHDQLSEEIETLFKRILNQKPFPLENDLKPGAQFLSDFMNFWPHWHLRIRQIIQLQLNSTQKIESCFQSQYTFASKVLTKLRLNFKIQKFCAELFEKVVQELEATKQELDVDFSLLYEKWSDNVINLPQLKRFLEGGEGDIKFIKKQLQILFGNALGQQEVQTLIDSTIQFQRKQGSIDFLKSQVGEEDIPEGVNLRLSWLVWKKILTHRQKIQSLATNLLSCLIQSYQKIPHQIKFVVRCFKEQATKKFGQLRFQDLKSFFNKVIFSQLFFAEFMNGYESRTPLSPNTNLTHLALICQKIMFGQQFNQKYKFGFLNPIINQYLPTIKQFILGFAADSIRMPPKKNLNVLLASFQSIDFMYQILKDEIRLLPGLQMCLGNNSSLPIGGKIYQFRSVFVCLVQKIGQNYSTILKPNHKIQKTMIQFLLMIDKISEKKSLKTLIEQYRCSQQDSLTNRPSVQLYAIYLEEVLTPQSLPAAIEQIQKIVQGGRKIIQLNKIALEEEVNYSANLQKMFMSILNESKLRNSKNKLNAQINQLMNVPVGFQYEIIDGKICEGGNGKNNKTFKKCLQEISESFLESRQGVDGLYHLFTQRLIQQLQKGVVPHNMAENAKNIIGQRLYSMLKLDTYMSEKDKKLYKKMQQHQFVTLTMLDLPQYQEEEELILSQSLQHISKLSKPCCPDTIIKVFLELTLVFQNVILITGSANDITADVQIPMMLVSIIRSKVRNLITLLDFVQKFCADDIHSSVLGQTFTLMHSVVYLIQSELEHTKLNMSKQEYEKNILRNSFVIVE